MWVDFEVLKESRVCTPLCLVGPYQFGKLEKFLESHQNHVSSESVSQGGPINQC